MTNRIKDSWVDGLIHRLYPVRNYQGTPRAFIEELIECGRNEKLDLWITFDSKTKAIRFQFRVKHSDFIPGVPRAKYFRNGEEIAPGKIFVPSRLNTDSRRLVVS